MPSADGVLESSVNNYTCLSALKCDFCFLILLLLHSFPARQQTEHDIKTGKELLQEDFIIKNPLWHAELDMMVRSHEKAEIQALSSFGFQYLTQVYLPLKLQEGDWI